MKELFKGKKIILTGRCEGDTERAAEWYEDAEFARNVDTDVAYPRTPEEMEGFAARTPNAFPFYIRLAKNQELIGFIALHSIEWNNQVGTVSIGIGSQAHRGKGYAAEALALILQYAFCELNLYRVKLNAIDYNERALHLYRSAGFTEEGRGRGEVYRDGRRFDLVLMGILRPEWEALP